MTPISLRLPLAAACLLALPACQPPESPEPELHTSVRGILESGNLLDNPDGATGNLSGWTILQNGGNGWAVIDNAFFATSYGWGRRMQTIDLYARGLSAQSMASAPPIQIAEDFGWMFCPDTYYLKVQLLDANMNVVRTFDTGEVRQSGPCDYNLHWQTVSHVFTGYGPNVRYVRWEDGGKDSEWWGGHYGALMKKAVLKVRANLLDNPDGATGDLAGWTILQDGGNGWTAIDNAFFATSYGWGRRTQTIDLWAKGISSTDLASAPTIYVAEDFGWMFCPDTYYLKVELLDANMNVVRTFDTGEVQQSGSCDYNLHWQTVSHAFTGYGSNVRYVRWEDGGKDSEGWWGHYGALMKSAAVSVLR